ncbi:MAG: hypothetical protein KY476_07475 [Planctomycetes bacterium]|nr:hypothetical protein [Planctomycetota bacterium]
MAPAIFKTCLPCLVALAAALAVLVLLVRVSGARPAWRRLLELHRSQQGGVQSLAFVLTMPLFIIVVMFIVQVSQLMVGMVVVHYSAFAAARAASVWLPAEMGEPEHENVIAIVSHEETGDGTIVVYPSPASEKFRRIRHAAVLACAAVSPSRDLGISPGAVGRDALVAAGAAKVLYRGMVPSSEQNARTGQRIDNKLAYSDVNTFVFIEWRDVQRPGGRETYASPTYNPRTHPNKPWLPNEVGWQDAVTVHVAHRFALLPGPGRFLAGYLAGARHLPPRMRERIEEHSEGYSEPVYTTLIPAAVTITNEGLKSVQPYAY